MGKLLEELGWVPPGLPSVDFQMGYIFLKMCFIVGVRNFFLKGKALLGKTI
jgi:hypothetical protein